MFFVPATSLIFLEAIAALGDVFNAVFLHPFNSWGLIVGGLGPLLGQPGMASPSRESPEIHGVIYFDEGL